tara:strand:+ start:902 stop:2251 length:1350 start_codon:yes stop_codon:yes gene_type:complete
LQRQHEFDVTQDNRLTDELKAQETYDKNLRFQMDKMELEWAQGEVDRLAVGTDRDALSQAIYKRDALRVRVTEYANPTDTSKVITQQVPGVRGTEFSGPPLEEPTTVSGPDGPTVADGMGSSAMEIPGVVPQPEIDALSPSDQMADSMLADARSAEYSRAVKESMEEYASDHGPAGPSGAIAYGEYLMGREMSQKEIDAAMPTLLGAMPATTIQDGMFKLLMQIPDLQDRRRALFEWTGSGGSKARMSLMAKYGSLMNIPVSPQKVDPYIFRKGVDVQIPLIQLDRMQRYLNRPEVNGKMGPVSGWLHGQNPWDTDMGVFKAVMMGSTQIIGKFLEGGVLRAEDTVKYRAILPNYMDTPAVAQGKIDNLDFILKAMERLYKTGSVGTTFDDNGEEVPNITFPDLPWNPGSESVPLQEINTWLLDNQDHENASEVYDVYQMRLKIWQEAQ